MGNHSKLIGSIVGGVAGALVSFGVLPEELATPEIQSGIVGVMAAVVMYFFPANQPTE